MHPNRILVEKLYSSLDRHDFQSMSDCYHSDATFEDIAFSIRGKSQITAMWHLVSETDLRATFKVLTADDNQAIAELFDTYTFRDTGRKVVNRITSEFTIRDNLIFTHRDSCNSFMWGIQALGLFKGTISWLVPSIRKRRATEKLRAFVENHPEYQS